MPANWAACNCKLDANERNEIAVALYESEGYSATGATWDGGRYLFFRREIPSADTTPVGEAPST